MSQVSKRLFQAIYEVLLNGTSLTQRVHHTSRSYSSSVKKLTLVFAHINFYAFRVVCSRFINS